MSSVEIRSADKSDAEELAAVYRNAYQVNRELGFPMKAESASKTEVSTWIREYWVYVVVVNSDIAGGVRLAETDPHRVKLSRLGVHEQQRGEGIGSRLLEYAESSMRNRGYRTLWLTTPVEHPYLPAFYRERGFEKTGPYPLEYRSYDEVIMEKQI